MGLGLGMRLAHGAALVVAAEAHERGDDGLHPDGRLFGVGRSSQSHTHTMSLAIVSLAMVSWLYLPTYVWWWWQVRAACTELAA